MRNAILFDGEGVVIDSERIWDKGQTEFLQRRGIVYDRDADKPLLAGRSLEEGVRLLQSKYHFAGNPRVMAQERIAIVRNLFAREVAFVPGFKEFYARMSPQFESCIATMMPRVLLDVVIAKLDLRSLFGAHIYCPEDGPLQGKPAPDLFLFAADKLGRSPHECVVIEDAPNGIEAARRAGMFSVGIATTFEPGRLEDADIVVKTFEEIDLSKLAG